MITTTITSERTAQPKHRTYESAIKLINSRQRQRRPNAAATSTKTRDAAALSSGTPDLRGTPGLVGMSEWLQSLGHSEQDINSLNVIHVAGTKGKGSTCAFIESFLRAHGHRTGFPYKTGLYSSPHLMFPEERIRINSTPLSHCQFAQYFFEIYDHLPQLMGEFDPSKDVIQRGPRYLQLFALLALHTFIREKVDVAILETHCGGEYDATNIVQKPTVTAVTTLGMDHVDMLGPTLENIAWHKAGIFKSGAVALSAPQLTAPGNVLRRRGTEKGVDVEFVQEDPRLPSQFSILEPSVQKTNASLAIAAAQRFLKICSPASSADLTSKDVLDGVKHFFWPGRFQTIVDGVWTWYLDAAHNKMSVEVAAEWFGKVTGGLRDGVSQGCQSKRHLVDSKKPSPLEPRILIFSHINELRDSAALLEALARALQAANVRLEHVIFSTYDEKAETKGTDASTNSELFYRTWRAIDPNTKLWNEPTIQGAIALARKLGPNGIHTLITGSQHLVGPALRILDWKP